MKKTLRLITTYKCPRKCVGCCNKQSNFLPDNVPVVDSLLGYDEIIITGGEPLLFTQRVHALIRAIQWFAGEVHNGGPKIILYTAMYNPAYSIAPVLSQLNGITYTLHEDDQIKNFLRLDTLMFGLYSRLSLRLNVFKGVPIPPTKNPWKLKKDIEWIDNCPLPENEDLRKLKNLW